MKTADVPPAGEVWQVGYALAVVSLPLGQIWLSIMLFCAVAFNILFLALSRHFGAETEEARCLRKAGLVKSLVAILVYALAVPAAFLSPALSICMNIVVATLYFLPNSWMEKKPKG